MKILKYIYTCCFLVAILSCNEDEMLTEKPLDFLTAENAYVTPEGINSALVQLYSRASEYMNVNSAVANDGQLWMGTDVCYHARSYSSDRWSIYEIQTDDSKALDNWEDAYKIVFGANVILNRAIADAEEPIEYLDENLRNIHLGEAAFFRAYAYRALVHQYGDVPLILDEVSSAKRDYVRASRLEVLSQMISDFQFATENLPAIDDVTDVGRIPKAAAYHYLAETYIANDQDDLAITAASWVINNTDYDLMTDRFGSRADEDGDVYWDLFRLNNQNRTSGNTETIWAFQNEYPTEGGDLNVHWERVLGGEYNRFQAKGENEGIRTFIYESTYKGGRAQGYFRPTSHVTHGIWADNFNNDIRNSDHNVLRKWWVDNPLSVYYGDTIDISDPLDIETYIGGPRGMEDDTNRYVYPYFLKFTRVNNHETDEMSDGSLSDEQLALATPEHIAMVESYGGVGPKLDGSARRYRADVYALRLAETYLLRAEAYLNDGQSGAAAADINVVRSRSNASPVSAGNVDIDYILDERLRELLYEEPRRITLGRLGLLYDRVNRFNDYATGNVQPHHNLLPIPLDEIKVNTGAELTQNDGYE